jgi:hypothetical protein
LQFSRRTKFTKLKVFIREIINVQIEYPKLKIKRERLALLLGRLASAEGESPQKLSGKRTV